MLLKLELKLLLIAVLSKAIFFLDCQKERNHKALFSWRRRKRGGFIPPFWFVKKFAFCLERLPQSFFVWVLKICLLEHQRKKERSKRCRGRGRGGKNWKGDDWRKRELRSRKRRK